MTWIYCPLPNYSIKLLDKICWLTHQTSPPGGKEACYIENFISRFETREGFKGHLEEIKFRPLWVYTERQIILHFDDGELHHFKLIFQKLFSSVIVFSLLLAQKFMPRDGGELKCTAMKDLVNFSKITLHCHKIAKCLLRANKRNTNFDHHFRQQIKFSCYFYDFASFITVSLSSVLLRARKMCLNFPKQTKRQTQINCYNNAGWDELTEPWLPSGTVVA